jgi:hypothetical protein
MKGRPLPGQVERPFGAPERFTPDEFAAAVLGARADDDESPPPPDEEPRARP